MILACAFGMFPPTKNPPGRKKANPSTIPPKPNWCKDLCRCDGRWGGYGMGGGCNVVMLLVASHSSKGGQYGKGQVPPISYSLGWMLQQVPLKALMFFFIPVFWAKSILLSQWLETWWVLSWLSHFWSWHGNSTLAPFSGLPRQRLSFGYCRSSCVPPRSSCLFPIIDSTKDPRTCLGSRVSRTPSSNENLKSRRLVS